MRTWRKNYQPPSRRFQDAYLAQKLSTTKPPVPGCVPGAKTINHQATGSRMRTWRKNYQPPSRRFQDAYLAQKLSTTKQPVPGCVPGAKTDCTFGHRRWHGEIIGTTTSLFETGPEGPELEGKQVEKKLLMRCPSALDSTSYTSTTLLKR